MKEELLSSLRGVASAKVIEAMDATPRELFVEESMRQEAYEDRPLPIGCGQTISAPHMVAIMCDILDLRPGMKVLEVGTGYGYHAAVIGYLVGLQGIVYSIERIPQLAQRARENLARAGRDNVVVVVGDGSQGLAAHAPFDRISVAATSPSVPQPLLDQLSAGGMMVIPVGSHNQDLLLVKKNGEVSVQRLMGVLFVPLIGQHGFKER